jgi:hypothetical protein
MDLMTFNDILWYNSNILLEGMTEITKHLNKQRRFRDHAQGFS